ncbi:Hypothetical_protein [Hexamita inflata]|uniref:Hypothetical_protein n=1 Tax=Hexamita inflata TaxID=28002 RepID=A0ABP1HDH6_9EUKA
MKNSTLINVFLIKMSKIELTRSGDTDMLNYFRILLFKDCTRYYCNQEQKIKNRQVKNGQFGRATMIVGICCAMILPIYEVLCTSNIMRKLPDAIEFVHFYDLLIDFL